MSTARQRKHYKKVFKSGISERRSVKRGNGGQCFDRSRAGACLLDDGECVRWGANLTTRCSHQGLMGESAHSAGQDGLCGRHGRIRVSPAGAGPPAQLASSHAQSPRYVSELAVDDGDGAETIRHGERTVWRTTIDVKRLLISAYSTEALGYFERIR